MAATLDQLQQQRDQLVLEAEIANLQSQVNAVHQLNSLVVREGFRESNSWGDMIDPREPIIDTPSFYSTSQAGRQLWVAHAHQNGDNLPFWTSEQEWLRAVGICNFIGQDDEVAIAAVENLTNYCVGTGYTYTFAAKSPEWEDIAKVCQRIVDSFVESNDWEGDLERELFARARIQGDLGLALEHRGGINVEARIVDPAFITEPADARGLEDFLDMPSLDWKYGVATEWGNTNHIHGYFVQWHGNENDWEFYDPAHFEHWKPNVHREVKRGLSDLFPVYRDMLRAARLFENTTEGAAIQAAIAYIREHSPGTPNTKIESLSTSGREFSFQRPTENGTKTQYGKMAVPGKVVDMKAGTKYHAGPMGQPRGQSYIEIVQAGYRRVGIRWTMPEYMISGDASNNNFASTLVAESPFTKSTENRQAFDVRKKRRVFWKVIGILAKAGLVKGLSLQEIKANVELNVDAPEVAVRDRLQEHQIRREEREAGILSRTTWSSEVGRDLEDELDLMRQEGPAAGQPGTNGDPTGSTGTAARQVLQGVAQGAMPESVGVELMCQLGFPRDRSISLVSEAQELRAVHDSLAGV